MATVQEWEDFTQDAAQKLETARQNMENVLNDPDASQARKDEARTNYEKQKRYYELLAAKNQEVQQSGVAPVSWTIPAQNFGSGVYRWSDNELYPVTLGYPLNGGISDSFRFASAEHFEIVVTYTYPGAGRDNQLESMTANFPPDTQDGSFGLKPAAGGSWSGNFSWTAQDTKGNLTNTTNSFSYTSGYAPHPCIGVARSDFPSIAAGRTVGVGSWNGDIVSRNICGSYVSVTIPAGTVTDPWDYYNDILMSTINPDDRMYPGGYNPDPEKPDADMPVLPGEGENGGVDIEPNDTTGIGAGFGFLTQYVIRGTDLEILGKLLWAGFRTGTQQDIDSYLMNFVYNVNADTGSMNFSDIMEFFVSLKMYPFPLVNITTLTPHGNHIHVGAGYTAIGDNPALPSFPNTIYTMDSYLGKISAGSVYLPFWFRDYRDYSIQITLYLPYCGTAELNPGDVMGGTLDCNYYVDFCTGSCTALVECTTWDGHKFPVATMPGQIGADVPMSATNAGRIAARIYSDRIAYAENIVGTLKAVTTGAGAIMSGNYAGAARQGFAAFIDPAINEEKIKAGQMERGAIAAPVLSAGGGFTSFCNPSTAYVTYRTPFYPDISNYPDSVGKPATEQVTIDNCTGFCQFVNVNVSGITAETREKELIIQELSAGIYI